MNAPQQTAVRRFAFVCDNCNTRGIFETQTQVKFTPNCIVCTAKAIPIKELPRKPPEPDFRGYGDS